MCNLCDETTKVSQHIHQWYNQQKKVREETLTQYMLHELSRRCQQIRHVEFDHHQERHNGADWDWYVLFPDGVVHLRIQAKKLHLTDNREGMTYPNRTSRQINTLINSSAVVGAMAVYVFYWKDKVATLCSARKNMSDGVFVCSANIVNRKLIGMNAKVTASDALSLSLPLPCLFCCPRNTDRSGRLWLDRIKEHYGEDSERRELDGGFSESMPPMLAELLERDMKVDDQWYQKHRSLIKDTNAIMVLDNRKGTSKQ